MSPGLRSFRTSSFRKLFDDLPQGIQRLANQKYQLFRQDPFHPSLEFQQKGTVWTVAIGRSYRAVARRRGDELYWVWIGSHEDYNHMLTRLKLPGGNSAKVSYSRPQRPVVLLYCD